MFRLGASTSRSSVVVRPLDERVRSVGYAAMAYWFYRWDWGEAIAVDGLWETSQVLGLGMFREFAIDEASVWLGDESGRDRLDPMGPVGVALDLVAGGHLADADRALSRLVSLADGIVADSEACGGLSPHGRDDAVFVDALYGFPAFLVRLGALTGSPDLVDRAMRLTLAHCRRVQRPETGLFVHLGRPGGPGDSPAWGRGNGWAVLGLADLLTVAPPDHDATGALRERLTAAFAALRSVQTAGGAWRNIVDAPGSYPEASTTAMVEAAVLRAIAHGDVVADFRSMAERAWQSIAHRVDTNGHVVGVSYRPGVNEDPRRYEHTPAVGAYPWGQGAYLRAACLAATDPNLNSDPEQIKEHDR